MMGGKRLFDCEQTVFYMVLDILQDKGNPAPLIMKYFSTDGRIKTIDRILVWDYNSINISPRPLLALLQCCTHTWGRSVF